MGQKEAFLRVLAIPFPPESAYSVPDNAFLLRDGERSLLCSGNSPKSPKSDDGCPK